MVFESAFKVCPEKKNHTRRSSDRPSSNLFYYKIFSGFFLSCINKGKIHSHFQVCFQFEELVPTTTKKSFYTQSKLLFLSHKNDPYWNL